MGQKTGKQVNSRKLACLFHNMTSEGGSMRSSQEHESRQEGNYLEDDDTSEHCLGGLASHDPGMGPTSLSPDQRVPASCIILLGSAWLT